MYPVTFFYFIFATNVKVALKDYYKHINKPFNNLIYFHHLRYFAICMCDRFVSKITPHSYTFNYDNHEYIHQLLKNGGIVAMSHFGGWATAGNCFKEYPLSIVMQEILLKEIKEIEDKISKEEEKSNVKIIDISKDSIKAAIEIANALMENESVAMMADRSTIQKHNKEIEFFDTKANFNKNPFEIAYKTQKPLIVIFVIYQNLQTYKLEFLEINMEKNKIQEQEVQKAMQAYVKKFEATISEHPEQWFNFYNFWEEGK